MEAAAVGTMRGGNVRFVALDGQHAPLRGEEPEDASDIVDRVHAKAFCSIFLLMANYKWNNSTT